MSFLYHRPSDRVTGTWSLSTGTARTGYPASNLGVADPSQPCWITGNSLRAVCDLGSAQQVDHVYIVGHTFVSGCNLRLQMHTSSSWGAPDVDIAVTIPTAYSDGFAYNLHVDVKAAYPSAGNRTKRYLSVANLSSNSVTVAIGEVWIANSSRSFSRGIPYNVQQRQRVTASFKSKRGVESVFDFGANARLLKAAFRAKDADYDDLRALEDDARGDYYMFPVVLDAAATKNRFAEPMLVRLNKTVTDAQYEHSSLINLVAEFREQAPGAVLGA